MFGTEARVEAMLQDYPSAVMLITLVMAFLMTGPMFLIGGINTQVRQDLHVHIITLCLLNFYRTFQEDFLWVFQLFKQDR